MFSTELPNITDFKELDLALLTLVNTTELMLFNLKPMQTEVEDLALAQDEARKPLLITSNRLKAMAFIAQSISELSEHSVQLCHERKGENTFDMPTFDNNINPMLLPTIEASLSEASNTTSMIATVLTHYAEELTKDSYNSNTISGIKNTLATLLPIFIICYTTASKTPDNQVFQHISFGVHNE